MSLFFYTKPDTTLKTDFHCCTLALSSITRDLPHSSTDSKSLLPTHL